MSNARNIAFASHQFDKTRHVLFRYLAHILVHPIELLSLQQLGTVPNQLVRY
ncbi:Uncharacterised protein [Vibrio cholerae]|nr:Uncharacterised protein [Vibrio cholerae]CSC37455.1 Uncharacterised protein [Vibrio cholerae]CSC97873.1 Uncharacterised protein [Vibrio cholerae]CSD35515.1 Uncharacterised protein [Vibrio cholerae]